MDSRGGFLYPVYMNSPLLRDLLIHAVHEFRDSLRSKRAIVVLLVYLGGSILMCNGFISLLSELEESLLANLRVAPTDATGSVTQTLWKTPLLKDALTKLAGDPHLVAHLTRKEPLSVYFFWMTSIFAPVILMMISPTRVSDEMSTGSARFVLFRSSSASWVLGKVLGQFLLLFPALIVCAGGAWLVGWFRLSGFDGPGTARDLFTYSVLLSPYLLCFLFAATAVSQLTRSSNLATAFGFIFVILSSALAAWASRGKHWEGWDGFWSVVLNLLPQGYRKDLTYPDAAHVLPAVLILFCLGVFYLLPGYRLLSRRDT